MAEEAAGAEDRVDGLTGTEGGDPPAEKQQPAGPNYEEIARQSGWRPEEEYEGQAGTWVGAEEFVKRAPLFEKIKGQSKLIQKMEKTLDAMAKHHEKTLEATVKRRLAELQAEKREAIEVGDAAKVEAIEKEMEETKVPEPVKPAEPELPQEIQEFMDRNKWFQKDRVMTAFAIAHNQEYLVENPGDLDGALKATERAIRKAFSEKFENPRKGNPSTVETTTQPQETGTKGKYTRDRLTKDQKFVYDQIVIRNKQVSHDDFFKDLEEIGELE